MVHPMKQRDHPGDDKVQDYHASVARNEHNDPASRVALAIYSGADRRIRD